jgi:hypothetical protein
MLITYYVMKHRLGEYKAPDEFFLREVVQRGHFWGR